MLSDLPPRSHEQRVVNVKSASGEWYETEYCGERKEYVGVQARPLRKARPRARARIIDACPSCRLLRRSASKIRRLLL